MREVLSWFHNQQIKYTEERKKKETILPLRESYNNSHNMLFFSLPFPLLSADKAFSSKVKFYSNVLYALASNFNRPLRMRCHCKEIRLGTTSSKSLFRLGTKPSRGTRTLPPLVTIQSIYFSRMRCKHEADGKEVKSRSFLN